MISMTHLSPMVPLPVTFTTPSPRVFVSGFSRSLTFPCSARTLLSPARASWISSAVAPCASGSVSCPSYVNVNAPPVAFVV